MARAIASCLLIIGLGLIAAAQTAYNGVAPGKSTRAEAEGVLGKPVKEHSSTLVEYTPQRNTGRIFVQYAPGLKLTFYDLAFYTAAYSGDAAGKTVRFYGKPNYLAVTVDNESEGGYYSLTPARIAFYSPELYETAAAEAEETNNVSGLKVWAVRTFENGDTRLELSERNYRRRFAGEGTRFVNYELTLGYPKSRFGRPLEITSVWSREGSTMPPIRQVLKVTSDEYANIFNSGLGNEDGRQFANRKGKWKVDIFIEGQLMATATFEIY
jgi:hypothetical protein